MENGRHYTGSSELQRLTELHMALSSRSRIASSQLAEVRGSTYKCHQGRAKFLYNRCAVG